MQLCYYMSVRARTTEKLFQKRKNDPRQTKHDI